MRGFLIGFVMLVAVGLSVLSLRPGGLRRQLRFAARRFRLALALAAAYVVASGVIRFAFPDGPISDFGPPVLAVALGVVFVVFGKDPALPADPNRHVQRP